MSEALKQHKKHYFILAVAKLVMTAVFLYALVFLSGYFFDIHHYIGMGFLLAVVLATIFFSGYIQKKISDSFKDIPDLCIEEKLSYNLFDTKLTTVVLIAVFLLGIWMTVPFKFAAIFVLVIFFWREIPKWVRYRKAKELSEYKEVPVEDDNKEQEEKKDGNTI